jgi:hypothetical protein
LPFKVESNQIEKLVGYYIYVSEEFVGCQPGLETFDTNSKLRSDAANDKFYERYSLSLSIKIDPTNAEMSVNFILLTTEMPKRIPNI